ncbi:sigma-54-dependent transcriptional regulator [Brevifollis gellanilyticus]|uniref:DNA-binding transcriptional regulator NtrC n=1 Tax=Brevifollis gellanilyticus TaxID=748831 RepID=A0A512MDX6_9BACT|nr:sigma-54 dependent transcriptional regulator [Brevifollis gellanilyticus]GEP44937.1 sigma-54-dependent Fis family transcriptional regulator [Brevifollis gellanilyticus]
MQLLLIDDDDDFASSLTVVLEASGHEVTPASDGDMGVRLAAERDFDLVITDFRMPGLGGLQVLEKIRAAKPRLPVILMTAYSTTERAIEATKAGAFDYLMKPFDPPELLAVIERAGATATAARPVSLKESASSSSSSADHEPLIGRSRQMQSLFKEIGRLADMPVPVLILGETGTGKELIARALHQHGNRSSKSFIAVNCAAIPESLIESELFGHEKGAFTHAVARRIGRFEQAQDGTLFLDEIGDLPASVQVKLLRVLQERKVCRVGSTQDITLNVRILAATHRDLPAMIQAGTFREDLFYRLNTAILRLPPLRERMEDIAPLSSSILTRAARELGLAQPTLQKEALSLLEAHPWPGNIRELENSLRRLVIDSRGLPVGAAQVRQLLSQAPRTDLAPDRDVPLRRLVEKRLAEAREGKLPAGALPALLDDLEQQLYTTALEQAEGNQSSVAEWLGVSRVTVREKLDRYQLLPKRPRREP